MPADEERHTQHWTHGLADSVERDRYFPKNQLSMLLVLLAAGLLTGGAPALIVGEVIGGNFPGGDERTLGKPSGWPRVFSCARRISFVAGRQWRRTAVRRQRSVRFSRLSTRLGLATIDVLGPAFELIKHLHQRRAFRSKTIQDTSRKGGETDLHDQSRCPSPASRSASTFAVMPGKRSAKAP